VPYVNPNAKGFRLPTEGEWQYAASCAATYPWDYASGDSASYSGSATLVNFAWYAVNDYALGTSSSDYGTHVIGTKQANVYGLYDMNGNVQEWCFDAMGTNPFLLWAVSLDLA
jgi:formylglycine-generating enzyme